MNGRRQETSGCPVRRAVERYSEPIRLSAGAADASTQAFPPLKNETAPESKATTVAVSGSAAPATSSDSKPKRRRCGAACEIWSRVCGYFRPVANWNKGKKQEFEDRKPYKPNPNTEDKP